MALTDTETSRRGDRRIVTNVYVKTATLLRDNMEHLCIHGVGVAGSFQHNDYIFLNEVIPLCIDSIYSLYYIYFSQHNYIIEA